MKKNIILILLASLLLSSCNFLHDQRRTYIRDRGQDYLSSELIEPLEVLPPLTYHHSEVFPIPDVIPNRGDLNNIPIEPPGFGEAL